MGVVGVLAACLVGGGERFLCESPCSCSAAIFAAVGVLRGPRVIGGSLSGCKFFLDCAAGFFSKSNLEVWTDLRLLGFRWTLTGGGSFSTSDTLPVELLFKLLASNARLDFLLSKNDSSAGESLGDSYTFGIAGTGGTSSSSSATVLLCRFKAFGAGSLEFPVCEFRAWMEPVEVRTVLKLFVEPIERPEL